MAGHGKAVQDELREPARRLRQAIPAVYQAYAGLHGAAMGPGALEPATKELIALAIAVTRQCDGCIASHARGAARHGATADQVAEAIGVAIMMNGGPGTVYGPRAFDAFLEYAGAGSAAPGAAGAGAGAAGEPARPGEPGVQPASHEHRD